jgi:hypothetical protein
MLTTLLCKLNLGHHWVAEADRDGNFSRRAAGIAEKKTGTAADGPNGCQPGTVPRTSSHRILALAISRPGPHPLQRRVPAGLHPDSVAGPAVSAATP